MALACGASRTWMGRKMKAADGKGPIPHDGDLKSADTAAPRFAASEVGEEPQELVSHCPCKGSTTGGLDHADLRKNRFDVIYRPLIGHSSPH
jgi:hypothetical protein